jgi:hypothetical protein
MKFSARLIVTAVTMALSIAVAMSAKPQNDECVGAKVVPTTSFPYTELVQIADYTYNPTDLNTTCTPRDPNNATILFPDNRTIWWQFTAPADGILTVRVKELRELYGSGLNLILYLFTGSCTNNLKELKCENKRRILTLENLYKTVTAGVTYHIKVGEGKGISLNKTLNRVT